MLHPSKGFRGLASFFPVLGLVLVLSGFLAATSAADDPDTTRPNILFIMADDHAFQAISAYDDSLVNTPNIDRLAAEGVRFDRAFVGNSICSPARATVLTGKHSHANGVRNNIDVFDGSQQTVQALMRATEATKRR